jgi:hypothetical protein
MAPARLTPLARKLLTLLSERGDWMTRAQLADAIDKALLAPYTVRLLEDMAEDGVIEKRRSPEKSAYHAVEYRVKL